MTTRNASCELVLPGVHVEAAARLHMGFVNPAPGPGRSFGSIGLALAEPCTRIRLQPSAAAAAVGDDAERAVGWLRAAAEALQLPATAQVEVLDSIPRHMGLGSGTQLALAVGAGLARLCGRTLSAAQIAAVTQRGARSGIGIGAFDQGGFLVDGGRGSEHGVPPVVARLTFPETWRVILAFDPAKQGLHGQQEIDAFNTLPAFPERQVERLARLVLSAILPAVAEQNLQAFGAAITELQQRVGDHFAPAQGGRFASRPVGEALSRLQAAGATALGQSSWGTGFCVVEGQERAEWMVAQLRKQASAQPPLRFLITRARNFGARISQDRAMAAQPEHARL